MDLMDMVLKKREDSILAELWQGGLHPRENEACNTPRMRELFDQATACRAQLLTSLSKEQQMLLLQYDNLLAEYFSASENAVSIYACKLGAQLTRELLNI